MSGTSRPKIPIAGDLEADLLLTDEPFALFIGMLLDQQVPMEWAFRGPLTLKTRLGGKLDPATIVAMEVDDFVSVCAEKPAIHRFPASMGKRIWAASEHVLEVYDGDVSRLWTEAENGAELLKRLKAVPGYGAEKSKIFIAILAKRFDFMPSGWEKASAPFSDDEPRSVADVADEESLARVRSWKKMMKEKKLTKQD